MLRFLLSFFFFFNAPATTEIYTLSLHDALPISHRAFRNAEHFRDLRRIQLLHRRRSRKSSEEHTSELQSRENLVCRLLLEKKKKKTLHKINHHKFNLNIITQHLSMIVPRLTTH